MANVADTLEIKTPIRIYEADKQWLLPKQKIGIEIEIENVAKKTLDGFIKNKDLRSYWKHKTDGSLRDNGMEFITYDEVYGGIYGKDLTKAIDDFFPFATASGWKPSHRTGIHVHMDITDLDWDGSFGLFCLAYAACERAIFSFIGEERAHNIYCLPWYKAQSDLPLIASIFSDKLSSDAIKDNIHRLRKYSALNLGAIGHYGTAEFRHMETHLDKRRLADWINLIMAIKVFAKEHDKEYSNFLAFPAAIFEDPERIFDSIFPQELRPLVKHDGYIHGMIEGARLAQDLAALYASTDFDSAAAPWEEKIQTREDGLANKYFSKLEKKEKPKKNSFDELVAMEQNSIFGARHGLPVEYANMPIQAASSEQIEPVEAPTPILERPRLRQRPLRTPTLRRGR